MILFINRLLQRFGGSYLSNIDLIKDLKDDFGINHLLLVDNRWKKDELEKVPKLKECNNVFQPLWKSTLLPQEKIVSRTAQNICERIKTDETTNLVILGHESLIWLIPFLKNSISDIQTCVVHHGTPTHCLETLKLDFKRKFFEVLNYADLLVTVSPHLSNILSKYFKRKIITIPNLPHLPFTFRNTSRIKTDDINILQISTLRNLKQPFDGLELVEQLLDGNMLAKLTFVGMGDLIEEYIKLIYAKGLQNNVQLISFATREEVARLLHSHDFLFLPSSKEGLPRVAIEAMLSGTPVVISTGANDCNLVEEKINGLIFPTGDLKTAALKIRELASNYEYYNSLIQGGYNTLKKIKAWRKEALILFVRTINQCSTYSRGVQYSRIPIS